MDLIVHQTTIAENKKTDRETANRTPQIDASSRTIAKLYQNDAAMIIREKMTRT